MNFTAWFFGHKDGVIGPYSYTQIIYSISKKEALVIANQIAITNNWRFLQFI